MLNFYDLVALEEKSWDLSCDLMNDREVVQLDLPSWTTLLPMRLTRGVVQLNIHSSTDSWTLLTPTSEGKNLEIRLIANAFLQQVLFSLCQSK